MIFHLHERLTGEFGVAEHTTVVSDDGDANTNGITQLIGEWVDGRGRRDPSGGDQRATGERVMVHVGLDPLHHPCSKTLLEIDRADETGGADQQQRDEEELAADPELHSPSS